MVNKKLKRVNEKSVLFAVFILLAILALGSLFIVKPKITGFAVVNVGGVCDDNNSIDGDGCSVAGLVEAGWECEDGVVPNECSVVVSSVCGDGTLDDGEECDDSNVEDGDGCSAVCEIEEAVPVCGDGTLDDGEECDDSNIEDGDGCSEFCLNESSVCGDSLIWGDEVCDDGENDGSYDSCTIDCLDFGPYCGDAIINGTEVCDDGENNGEYDYCLADCSGDGPSCGDGSCNAAEDCDSCETDCGECEEDDDDDNDDASSDDEVEEEIVCGDGVCHDSENCNSCEVDCGGCFIFEEPVCSPNWECGEWSECVEESQSRSCNDINACGSEAGKPELSQACVMPETCSDGMKNQDEKGIDCGGVCEQRCSFFTIMGNAVNVPINSSKQFVQNNKAISFSILGVIVLVVGWVVCVKVFLKKKNIFFFVEAIKNKTKSNANS